MKLMRHMIIPALAAIIVLAALPVTVMANPGLQVTNTILVTNVSPGQTLPFKMTVGIGASDPATNIAVQVAGIVQSLDGTNGPLAASEDTSPYSARSFISVDKSSFQLEPGASQDVTATINIPQDVGAGGRYAIIHIVTQPPAGGAVSIATAMDVPVVLTVTGSELVHIGKITELTIGKIISGQPVNILTNFQNTGNIHYKVQGQVTINNAKGQTLDTISIPLTASSILPGATRQLEATFAATSALAPGTYTVDSKVSLQDGTLLDQANSTFTVNQQYMPPSSTTTAPSPTTPVSPAPAAGVSWPVVVGAAAGGAIIASLIYFLVARRRVAH